jgi:hypothetical protein
MSSQQLSSAYWHRRVITTLERLEREARRMLQLEEDLGQFAAQYYATVGAVTERLARVEERLSDVSVSNEHHAVMPSMLATREAAEARKTEIKTRYRSLAKEIHPDLAMLRDAMGASASAMHTLNAAYQHGDLAAMLKLEAELLLAGLMVGDARQTQELEYALRDVERAADTYAAAYRELLASPLNELMLRAMSARLAGWDWMQAVVRKVERTIEEKERAAALESIAQIGAWRDQVAGVA